MTHGQEREHRLWLAALRVYRWSRSQIIGRLPWGASFAVYRVIRRLPRAYLLMRAVLMREMAGRSK